MQGRDITERIIVLIGLMGAGKSRVGAELARILRLPFVDADKEIEAAAGMSISDIFENFGEAGFRQGEKKVMLRLLSGGACVLASGGGAFMQEEIRREIKKRAISVWLRAEVDTLVERTAHTSHRPLLREGDARQKLMDLMELRYPVYAEADIVVVTDRQPPSKTALQVRQAVTRFLSEKKT